MTTCPTCGFDRGEVVTRGPLRVERDPPRAYWRGIALHGLSPVMTDLLATLAVRGKASHFALLMCCPGADTDPEAVKVHLCKLRKLLPAGLSIESIHGWGYELKMETDMPDTTDTTKSRLAAAVADLRDDLSTAVLLYPDAEGRIAAVGVSATLPQVVHMLGLATASIGKRMVPAPG